MRAVFDCVKNHSRLSSSSWSKNDRSKKTSGNHTRCNGQWANVLVQVILVVVTIILIACIGFSCCCCFLGGANYCIISSLW